AAVADPEAFAAVERALGVAPAAGRAPMAPMVAAGAPQTVRFAHDSAALNAEARARIAEVAARYKEVGGRVRIVGHASSYTRDMNLAEHMLANFLVSADRARAVADELMRQGVAPEALIVDAVGDSQPLVTEAMPAGQAANRRVEIFFGA
ncbi:MAG: OmpA family protein, partial [Proteobacteria bacterium]|nr:OmpA family protein [Pseudomonadota bacterium]